LKTLKKPINIGILIKKCRYFVFFAFSLFNLLFSFRVNFGFLLRLESLNDFPLYLFDIKLF